MRYTWHIMTYRPLRLQITHGCPGDCPGTGPPPPPPLVMGDSVVMIGTDDGEQFWVKRGQLHRGAPGVAQLSLGNSTGTFNQHGVVWQDDHRRDGGGGGGGATWTRFTDGLNLSNVGDGSQQHQQQLVGFTALTYSEY
eukprot:COSAG01_NODE_18952_length_1041_cov_1.794055_1_plen_137_part_10